MVFARTPTVTVLGSANMDSVFVVDQMPQPGETVLALSAGRNAGGKGLNQAISCARAGVVTTFVGALGSDPSGAELREALRAAGVDVTLVRDVASPTGQAVVFVDNSAENMIVVDSGANSELSSVTAEELSAISSSDVLLMQMEVPATAVRQAARVARDARVTVVLNAAPVTGVDKNLLSLLDVLIVNEHEASSISGLADSEDAARSLATHVPTVIVTRGAEGSVVYLSDGRVHTVPAERVVPVDSTGAGDTYCGAFVASTAQGCSVAEAVAFATSAAALSVQTRGAVPSIPLRSDIDAFMKERQ